MLTRSQALRQRPGFGGLLRGGFLALLQTRGELVFALVALAAETGRATDRALRGRGFVGQLEDDQAAAVTDAVLGELDDPGVATGPVGELWGDLAEQLLYDTLSGEFLLLVDEPAVIHVGDDAAA